MADPFAYLGPHEASGSLVVRVSAPSARGVLIAAPDRSRTQELEAIGGGIFAGPWCDRPYVVVIDWDGVEQETEDPYAFGPVISADDMAAFAEGSLWSLPHLFGSAPLVMNGVSGVSFVVWAPNARRVSVVGDFNSWDGRRHPMRVRYPAGFWEIFIPRLDAGTIYKYEIVGPNGEILPLKADPVARATELPPATASKVAPVIDHSWRDEAWMVSRLADYTARPLSIYEVHAASWMRPDGDDTATLNWQGLTNSLVPYVRKLGFTHIELLPIMEHPFGGSWGYQPLSQFAPSARFGAPEDFAAFVDACHASGIGVILDWVPAHFPTDPHGLARFDGTPLYEHADPNEGFHQDWQTYIYNLGRSEVQAFLIASALYWLETFHIDGLRVDAVASMLYRDYSRKAGEWTPNIHGGRENLESVAFLRRLNDLIRQRCPGAMMIAEESTAWPGVSAPTAAGGLGFSFKWNMGWMHDTLKYMGEDPIHRRWHHGEITFGLSYAFSEHFVLPLSHDEVVHGKGSLYTRMPGDAWRKLANLRAYLTFMWTHPGKKLLFMGGEVAQPWEWNHDAEIGWDLLQDPGHAGIQRLVADLNALYREQPALHASDSDPAGFEWAVGDDTENSVFAFLRRAGAEALLIVVNLTPIVRSGYRIGVPVAGTWKVRINSDASMYGGSAVEQADVSADDIASHGNAHSLSLTLPPLGALVLSCPM